MTKNLRVDSPGTWAKTSTTVLLNKNNKKMTSNDIQLDSEIRVLLSYYDDYSCFSTVGGIN